MSSSKLIVPDFSKENFAKLLAKYQTFPQEQIKNEKFLPQKVTLYERPDFCDLGLEVEYCDGAVGEFRRKVEFSQEGVAAQLEDRTSFYLGDHHLGSTRLFKVIDQNLPFRIIESGIENYQDFRSYLLSVSHLVVYLDKINMRFVSQELGFALRYCASIATATLFCLEEKSEDEVTRCRDIIIGPLSRTEEPALDSVEIKCAGCS